MKSIIKILSLNTILVSLVSVSAYATSVVDVFVDPAYPPSIKMKASSGNAHRFIEYSLYKDGVKINTFNGSQNQYVSQEVSATGVYSIQARSYDNTETCVRNGPSLSDVVCTVQKVYGSTSIDNTQFKIQIAEGNVTPVSPAPTLPRAPGASCGVNANKIFRNSVCGSSIASTIQSAASFCGACSVQTGPAANGCVTVYCGN